jgi:hypothetical protein
MHIKHRATLITLGFVFFCSFLSLSCNTDSTASGESMGNLLLRLIDSPAWFDQEVIVMRRIEIHRSGASAELGWRVINGEVASYDVLKLRNGVSQVVASEQIPEGKYDAIRIVMEGSNVWIGGQYRLLELPPNVAGGFVLQYPITIAAGEFYELVLDFDAYRSIKQTGPNTYQLNPAIRAQDALLTGSVSGSVVGTDNNTKAVNSYISSAVGTDVASTLTDTTSFGSFLLMAIPEGLYDVKISPVDSLGAYKDTTIASVRVIRQRETKIGSIPLRLR